MSIRGPLEQAVRADIDNLPEASRSKYQALVQLCISLAGAIDMQIGAPAPAAKELRASLEMLYALAPASSEEGDPVSEFERRRSNRISAAEDSSPSESA